MHVINRTWKVQSEIAFFLFSNPWMPFSWSTPDSYNCLDRSLGFYIFVWCITRQCSANLQIFNKIAFSPSHSNGLVGIIERCRKDWRKEKQENCSLPLFATHQKSEGKESTGRTLKRIIPSILGRKGSDLGRRVWSLWLLYGVHLSCILQRRENSLILRCYTYNIFYIQNINDKKERIWPVNKYKYFILYSSDTDKRKIFNILRILN